VGRCACASGVAPQVSLTVVPFHVMIAMRAVIPEPTLGDHIVDCVSGNSRIIFISCVISYLLCHFLFVTSPPLFYFP
jgi:hypothetical protein